MRPAGKSPQLIHPPPPMVPATDTERLDVWGFADTRFHINERGHVELTGSRYLLSGQEMPDLLPWVERTFGVPIDPHDLNAPSYPPAIPASTAPESLVTALRAAVGEEHVVLDAEVRLRHGHGHTQGEMYAIKYGALPRVPDVVVLPATEAEVERIVAIGVAQGAALIPYGGGTNVSEALRCAVGETRPIVSIDLARMNRILWIDPVNRTARVQAGAVGRILAGQVREYGFTIGHEPDSIEFSTLGGWIATNASGMKKNRYGNIEDLVVDVRAVTPRGTLWATPGAPRESLGSDPRRWLFGSEGAFGVITEATIKLFPVPEAQRYGSVLFPDFERGTAFLYDLTQAEALPASVRLVDNQQLQLNFVLKPRSTGIKRVVSQLEKHYVTRVRGFEPANMVACTLVHEGTAQEVAREAAAVARIARRHGGLAGGAQNGERGYMLTYGIAYIRDWILNHWLIAESFETSTSWDRIGAVIDAVKARIAAEHAARGLPGRPFVTARVTQAYVSGVCIYFYYAFHFKGVENPSQVYHDVEAAARDAVLAAGGSLSHHHGVGTLRAAFLPRVLSEAALTWRREARAALDPTGVFAARTLGTPE